MERTELMTWLRETDLSRLQMLYSQADAVREAHVGPEVHFRGLVEFSNFCRRSCWYCGIRAPNTAIQRYRMNREHILEAARLAQSLGFGSIVLQSGEDPGLDVDQMCETIRQLKSENDLAVTLSLGERSFDELARLKIAGADRYLLRFETSNTDLYKRIHPPVNGQPNADRFEILRWLAELGYEVGTGIMVGIPGSTWDDLADDIEIFRRMDIDMIGIGPFIPHPRTPLGGIVPALPFTGPSPNNTNLYSPLQTPSRRQRQEGVDHSKSLSVAGDKMVWMENDPRLPEPGSGRRAGEEGPPNTPLMVLKVLALTRILCPDVNIPSTTALETLSPDQGYEDGLTCGANVIMPNLTDMQFRRLYEIYPGKTGMTRRPEELLSRITGNLKKMGRYPGKGPGMSSHFRKRIFEQ